MISRKERIASMVVLTTPLPENIDEDCEDCQHWIENHTTIYDNYENAYDITSRIADFAFTLDELWNSDKEIPVTCDCESCKNITTCHTTEGEE